MCVCVFSGVQSLTHKNNAGRYAVVRIYPDGFIDGTFVESIPTREEHSLISRYEGGVLF